MSRIGLGRHGGLDDASGDPLDGLVNLFDVGLVLAVAFLVAGLGLATTNLELPSPETQNERTPPPGSGQEFSLPDPSSAPPAAGRGEEVGKVYRLPDGRLLYVDEGEPPSD